MTRYSNPEPDSKNLTVSYLLSLTSILSKKPASLVRYYPLHFFLPKGGAFPLPLHHLHPQLLTSPLSSHLPLKAPSSHLKTLSPPHTPTAPKPLLTAFFPPLSPPAPTYILHTYLAYLCNYVVNEARPPWLPSSRTKRVGRCTGFAGAQTKSILGTSPCGVGEPGPGEGGEKTGSLVRLRMSLFFALFFRGGGGQVALVTKGAQGGSW